MRQRVRQPLPHKTRQQVIQQCCRNILQIACQEVR